MNEIEIENTLLDFPSIIYVCICTCDNWLVFVDWEILQNEFHS